MARHPAAFINNIADEGTKTEAIEWLQRTWDDLVDAQVEILNLKNEVTRADARIDELESEIGSLEYNLEKLKEDL